MNRAFRIAGFIAATLVITFLSLAQDVPKAQDVSGYFTKTSAPRIVRDVMPEYAISKDGKPCGFVDKGQMAIAGSVPFYAHTYTHFGARHDLRSVPYDSLPAAISAVERECR